MPKPSGIGKLGNAGRCLSVSGVYNSYVFQETTRSVFFPHSPLSSFQQLRIDVGFRSVNLQKNFAFQYPR